MSKIDDLIKQYCPNGVEYKELGKIVNILDSQRRPVAKEKRKKGNIPYYGANGIQDWVDDYIFDGTFLLIGEDGSVINKDNTPVLNWATGKIWVNNHAHILSEKIEEANLRYVYFILSKTNVCSIVRGMPPKLNQLNLRGIKIPIPPLPVQEEIVKVLDAFTALEAELEAELEARKRQYEYYRNKLLTFDENTTGGGIDWKILSEVFDIKNGYTPSKANKEFWKNGTIPWFRMEDIRENGRILNDSIQHITPQAVKGGKLFPANSIIVATTATIGEHALITVDSLANQRFTCLSKKVNRYNELDMKFFYYYMFVIDEWCKNNTNVSGFASVDMNKFKKLMIPIPPIEEQERIVAILDKFDSLVNDISEGLPAELTARRQQYEYYRNKLLTFEEAA